MSDLETLSVPVLQFALELTQTGILSTSTQAMLLAMPSQELQEQMHKLYLEVDPSQPGWLEAAVVGFWGIRACIRLNNFCQLGLLELVQAQVSRKEVDDLNVAMGTAAKLGHLEVVKFLVDAGATDLNWGMRQAALGGQLETLQYLVSLGANNYRQALETATQFGHNSTIAYLLEVATFDSLYGPLVNVAVRRNLEGVRLLSRKMRQLGGPYLAELADDRLGSSLTEAHRRELQAALSE